MTYSFTAPLWLYSGEKAAWHFITLPEDLASEIADRHALQTRGFGSLKVAVTIGNTTWQTSIFPDKKANSYFLPIKVAVRKAESLKVTDLVTVKMQIEK